LKITLDLINADGIKKDLADTIGQFQSFVATEFKRQVVPRTPIDQGRARAGWQQRQQGNTQIVENNVPYIERLEKGYSKQAPRGFVNQAITATINETKRKIK
jgi:hypothetical protein